MIWFVILVIAYVFAAMMVVNTDSKPKQLALLGGWAVLALLFGHLAWDIL